VYDQAGHFARYVPGRASWTIPCLRFRIRDDGTYLGAVGTGQIRPSLIWPSGRRSFSVPDPAADTLLTISSSPAMPSLFGTAGPGGPQRPASPGTDAGRYVTHVRGLAVSSAITAKWGRSRTKVLCRMPCGAVYWRGARCRGEAPRRRFRCRLFEAGEPAAHRCAEYLFLPPCGPSQRRV
jgi:hypothetical protein